MNEYVGLSLTIAAAAAIVGYAAWLRRTNCKRQARRRYLAFHKGYNYCAGQLLRGERPYEELENEADGRADEINPVGKAYNHGMSVALRKWRRLQQCAVLEISNG